MDDGLVLPQQPVVLERHAVGAGAGDDDEVAFRPEGLLVGRERKPELAEIGGMVGRQDVLPPERGDHARAGPLGEGGECAVGALAADQLAADDERARRPLDQARRFGDRGPARQVRPARPGRGESDRARLPLGHVLRQHDGDGARPAVDGHGEGVGGGGRAVLRAEHLDHALRQRLERRRVVDLLERFAAHLAGGHVADEEHERSRVLLRRVQPDGGVGRARAPGHEGRGRLAGALGVGVGGEGARRFVTSQDEPDPLALPPQLFQDRQIALARYVERHLDAVLHQRPHQGFAAVHPRAPPHRRAESMRPAPPCRARRRGG